MSAPLGEQPAPKVVRKQGVATTWLELTASPEMITAYLEWLESPAAHEAFGDWADSQGLDSWS